MHRLEDFIVRRVISDYVSLRREHDKDSWGAMLRCRLVEHMLWLHLGVEIGIFPSEPAEEFYKNFFQVFFRSLVSADSSDLHRMKAGELYVAHSVESNALILAFPRFARILIERAMRAEDIFSIERLEISDSRALRPALQTLLLLASQTAKLQPLTQFVHAVNFVEEEKWANDWDSTLSSEEIVGSTHAPTKTGPQICAGFLQIWGYALKLKEFFGSLEENRNLKQDDMFKLRQRTREIQSWILNLSSRQTSSRFEQVRKAVTRGIDSQQASYRTRDIAEESMESAFEFWFTGTTELETVDA